MNFERGEYNFKKDLEKGRVGEEFISKFLTVRGFKHISYCENNKYDLMMEYNRAPYTYEVKTDTYPINTGNIVIEVESRGKPSGISVTTADFFVTFFPNFGEIWTIKTDQLKSIIKANNFSLKIGGDKNSQTKFYLIDKGKYFHHFKLYKI